MWRQGGRAEGEENSSGLRGGVSMAMRLVWGEESVDGCTGGRLQCGRRA